MGVNLASRENPFIIVHENLVKHSSNSKWIIVMNPDIKVCVSVAKDLNSSCTKDMALLYSDTSCSCPSYIYIQADTPLEASRSPWGEGGSRPSTSNCIFKKKQNNFFGVVFFFLVQFLFGGLWYPSPKWLKTFLGTMRSYSIKEIQIGLMVSKILWYMNTHKFCYFIIKTSGFTPSL